MVKCSECGFLGVRRRMLAHAFPGLMEVTAKQRATWDFGPYKQQPLCYRQAFILVEEAGSIANKENFLEVIHRDRKCDKFREWQHDYSPREHLDEMKIEQLQRFNRNMTIFLAIVAFGTLAVGIAAMIIALNQRLIG